MNSGRVTKYSDKMQRGMELYHLIRYTALHWRVVLYLLRSITKGPHGLERGDASPLSTSPLLESLAPRPSPCPQKAFLALYKYGRLTSRPGQFILERYFVISPHTVKESNARKFQFV